MSLYPSSGQTYAGWSTGRWFGLAGVVALAFALLGRQALHGWLSPSLDLTDQMIATFAEYVGGGLFFIMTVAAVGSISISRQERGDIEVTDQGVARIFASGKRTFLPRVEIAGFAARPYGGVDLIDDRGRNAMAVPRSVVGYRDCIAELKAMGIAPIPPKPSKGVLAFSNPMSWKERIQLWSLYAVSPFTFAPGALWLHLVGAALTAALLAWIAVGDRHDPARRWRWVTFAGLSVLYSLMFRFMPTLRASIRHWW